MQCHHLARQDSSSTSFSDRSASSFSTASDDDDLTLPSFEDEHETETGKSTPQSDDIAMQGDEEPPYDYKRHGRAILTDEQAREIFRHKPSPDSKERDRAGILARTYGVSVKTVRDIWVGRTWYRATVHLDPSKPVSAERLQRRPGRPRGVKDSRPRTRKWPRFDTAAAALGLDPRLLMQLADAARAGRWPQGDGASAGSSGGGGDTAAFDVVAAAARFFALAPLALQTAASASAAAAAGPAAAAADSSAPTPSLPTTPPRAAPGAAPSYSTPAAAPRPLDPPAVARNHQHGVFERGWAGPGAAAGGAPLRDMVDPFQPDFGFWSSANMSQPGPAEAGAGAEDGGADWGEPLACNLRLRFDPVACSREWGAPWPHVACYDGDGSGCSGSSWAQAAACGAGASGCLAQDGGAAAAVPHAWELGGNGPVAYMGGEGVPVLSGALPARYERG